MKWTQGIYDKIRANSALQNLVGNKVYPLVAPEGTALPYIVYEVTNTTVEQSHDKSEAEMATFEVVLYCKQYADAALHARNMRIALDRENCKRTNADDMETVFLQEQEIERIVDPEGYAVVSEFEAFVQFK